MSGPRVPRGISNVRRTSSGWSAKVSLYTDEAGYFGRRCPDAECHAFFKLNTDEFAAASESLRLTCPECGNEAHHTEFMTPEQTKRSTAGVEEFGAAVIDQVLRDFSRQMGTQRFKGGRIEWRAHRNPPRIPRPLPSYVERATLRLFTCPRGHTAVIYDKLAFCPWCGHRHATTRHL